MDDNIADETASREACETGTEEIKPEFEIKVTEDQLTAYVRLADNGVASDIIVREDEILSLLKNNSITYGIMEADIKDFCLGKNYYEWHKVALGTHAVDGEDG